MSSNFFFLGLADDRGCVSLQHDIDVPFSTLKESLRLRNVDSGQYYYTHNGRPLQDDTQTLDVTREEEEAKLVIIRAHPRIVGGKGGFGALIRAMGSHGNKSKAKEAARDLNGRRMRDVNAEKKMAEWAKKEPERRKEAMEKKARKRRELLEGPRHFFNDPEYMQRMEENRDQVEEALRQGLMASSGTSTGEGKRQRERDATELGATKKRKMWGGIEDEFDSDELDSDTEGDTSPEHMDTPNDTPNAPPIDIPNDMPPEVPTEEQGSPQHDEKYSVTAGDEPDSAGHTSTAPPNNTSPQPHSTSPTASTTSPVPSGVPCTTSPVPSGVPCTTSPVPSGVPCTTSPVPPSTSTNNASPLPSTTSPTCTTSPIPFTTSSTQPNASDADLDQYRSVSELEVLGPDLIKALLQDKGLKCGGTLRERAQRLFAVKGLDVKDIDPSLFAKANGRNKGKKKKSSNK